VSIPANYPRTSVSHLMWQYAQRTERDLLPPHYRSQPLFFRRPPRLPQRQLKDAHLLLMRELAAKPGMAFADLQQSTGLGDKQLARCLSALYVVGSITANPKRATGAAGRVTPSELPVQSAFNSVMDTTPRPGHLLRGGGVPTDMTAPLPLLPDG
jgi:hypothetical protein